jgi:hypothetical protein
LSSAAIGGGNAASQKYCGGYDHKSFEVSLRGDFFCAGNTFESLRA